MLSPLTKCRRRISAIISMNNTPETPTQKPEFYAYQGGNFWTLFTPRTWKVLHAVLQQCLVDGSFCPLPQQLRAWHIDAAQEPSTASVSNNLAGDP